MMQLQDMRTATEPYFFVARIRILMSMAYRFEVFTSIAGQLILMTSTLFIWRTAFRGDLTVEGLALPQMLVYAVISALLGIVLTAGVADTIRDRVMQGQISTDLLRPVEPMLLWLAEDVGQSISSLLTKGLPVLVCGYLMAGTLLPASLEAFLFFLPACVLAYLILWLLTALVAMTAFWTVELGQLNMVKNALVGILSGSFVPLWFFPEWFSRICDWLPFVYTYQGSLGIFIGKTTGLDALRILGLQAFWVVLLSGLLLVIWSRARRKVLIQGG